MIQIIRETGSWLCVYKPAGLPVETKQFMRPDLESEVRNYLTETAANRRSGSGKDFSHASGKDSAGGSGGYAAAINRLDQPVEGIVLFAKNRKAAAALSAESQAHRMKKIYRAVVGDPDSAPGNPAATRKNPAPGRFPSGESGDNPEAAAPGNSGTQSEPGAWVLLEDYLQKDGRTNLSRVVPPGTPGARKAVLRYRVLAKQEERILLEVVLETGRHHQIRAQLANQGLPILGDRKYGAGVQTRGGIALAAVSLAFTDPDTRTKVCVTAPPKGAAFAAFRE